MLLVLVQLVVVQLLVVQLLVLVVQLLVVQLQLLLLMLLVLGPIWIEATQITRHLGPVLPTKDVHRHSAKKTLARARGPTVKKGSS